MIRLVPTGDLGLDVLLGGGWRLVKRFEDKDSATVIIRGGSGAGKTLVGIQAALELARALGGDVAVGCVEILPSEYIAQLQSARPSLPADRVARLPSRAVADDGPRVYVALLQLETDQPDLVTALEQLDARVREAGGNPTAFIVDSLIDGYGIGSKIERIIADDVLRFAANYGRALVLCEETVTDEPSPWVFAADTVLQVGVESRERGRWIEVKKHRFGPSATGRHELDLAGPHGPAAFPSDDAWRRLARTTLSAPNHEFLVRGEAPELSWAGAVGDAPLECRAHNLLVTSREVATARALALMLRPASSEWSARLLVHVEPTIAEVEITPADDARIMCAWLPRHHGPRRFTRWVIDQLRQTVDARSCIILDDIAAFLDGPDGEMWLEALLTICLVAYDTRPTWTIVACEGRVGQRRPWQEHLREALNAWVLVQDAGDQHDELVVTYPGGRRAGTHARWPKIQPVHEPWASATQTRVC